MYSQHPLSAAFPSMLDEDFQSLKDSIETNGVLNPITIFEGMVIDGWHRYQAANQLAMDCPEQPLGDIDPKDFVLAQNKNRRHITAAQLAAAATAVYAWVPLGANQHTKVGSVGPSHPPKTNQELANIAGVSVASIKQAKVVQERAAPEVQQAVKDGKVGLEKAVAISKLPKEEQAAAIAKPLPKRPEYSLEDRLKDEIAGKQEAIEHLAEENQRLKDGVLTADDPTAAEVIASLREQLASAQAELDAIKSQRDLLMSENHELKKQCGMYMKKLKLVA